MLNMDFPDYLESFDEGLRGEKVVTTKIAVVGLGRIGIRHIEAILQCSTDFELCAVCDIDKKTLANSDIPVNINRYEILEEMLEHDRQLDYVAICTPSGLHSQHCIKIASHGSGVITEKPMATRWLDAKQMLNVCDNHGVDFFVVKQNRLNPTLKLLKRAVLENRFGKIHLVQINVFWTRPQSYYDQAEWRGTWEFDGGALMNQASHYVDLLDWLFGPIEFVNACSTTFRNIEVEDTAVVNLGWRSGALGSMAVTMLTYPKNLEGSITVIGEKGTVSLGGVALNEVKHWEFSETAGYDASVNEASYQTDTVYGNGHVSYYRELAKHCNGLVFSLPTGREALKTMEVLVACYLSAREKKTVYLPLTH